jgi:hypothetical protein
MEYMLPPTEPPFGLNCAKCPLFPEGQCAGVSAVRVAIGLAQRIEESYAGAPPAELPEMNQPAVTRGFRILQRTLVECPGPGNDGKGDFRKSTDRLSGFRASIIIRVALQNLNERFFGSNSNNPTPKLTAGSASFIPSESSRG